MIHDVRTLLPYSISGKISLYSFSTSCCSHFKLSSAILIFKLSISYFFSPQVVFFINKMHKSEYWETSDRWYYAIFKEISLLIFQLSFRKVLWTKKSRHILSQNIIRMVCIQDTNILSFWNLWSEASIHTPPRISVFQDTIRMTVYPCLWSTVAFLNFRISWIGYCWQIK